MAKPDMPLLMFYILCIMFIFILPFLNQLLMCYLSHTSSHCDWYCYMSTVDTALPEDDTGEC